MLRRAESTINLVQSRQYNREMVRVVNQVQIVRQSTRSRRYLNRQTTSSLTFVGEVYRSRIDVDNESTLTLTQATTRSATLNRRLNNNITIISNLTRNATINRTTSSSISFLPNREIFNTSIPNLQNVTITNPEPQRTGFNFQAAKIVRIPTTTVLQVPSRTIVLPGAELNNRENRPHEVQIKRTMTGGLYTYVRRSYTDKFIFSFVLWTDKVRELKQFIAEHGASRMTIWHIYVWSGYLTNVPVFDSVSRYDLDDEKYTTTLEFEGVRL